MNGVLIYIRRLHVMKLKPHKFQNSLNLIEKSTYIHFIIFYWHKHSIYLFEYNNNLWCRDMILKFITSTSYAKVDNLQKLSPDIYYT